MNNNTSPKSVYFVTRPPIYTVFYSLQYFANHNNYLLSHSVHVLLWCRSMCHTGRLQHMSLPVIFWRSARNVPKSRTSYCVSETHQKICLKVTATHIQVTSLKFETHIKSVCKATVSITVSSPDCFMKHMFCWDGYFKSMWILLMYSPH